MENDRSYFSRRAAEERTAADKSENPKAREAHQKMAERYEEQAQTVETRSAAAL